MTSGKDEHIIEAIGKCRVVIRDGKVVEVGETDNRRLPSGKTVCIPRTGDHRKFISEGKY